MVNSELSSQVKSLTTHDSPLTGRA